MDTGSIIILGIAVLAAAFLTGVGIKQIRSQVPVTFYLADEPPSEGMLKSVRAWNNGHGALWIGYGVIVLACFVPAVLFVADPLIKTLLMFCGGIFPAGGMALGHNILVKRLYK